MRRSRRRELLHHVSCVDLLPIFEGGQQANAHIDRSVAEGEHPAVARHGVALPVPNVQRALDHGIGRQIGLVIGADCHALWKVPVTARSDSSPETGKRSIGDHHKLRADFDGSRRWGSETFWRAAWLGCLSRSVLHRNVVVQPRFSGKISYESGLCLDHNARQDALGEFGGHRFSALPQLGTRFHRVDRHHLVEVMAPNDVAIRRKHWMLRPGQVQSDVGGNRPQPVVAVKRFQPGKHAHVGQLFHGPRRETISAGLVPGKHFPLDHQDADT